MKIYWVYYFYHFLILFPDIFNGENIIESIDISKFYGSDLYYDPDNDLSTLDMISRNNYPAEAHIVTTDDGYLLLLHRIPRDLNSPTVLLQHGLLGSSADWVIAGREKGLAYLLYDNGYDVWLGNARGNTYSRAHVNLSIQDPKFWNFSFHEMGIYDLPAIITRITNEKQNKLIYVGHSMGTTMGYVMACERPEIMERVALMISFAPIAFMKNLKSPVRKLAPFVSDIELMAHVLGVNEFLPQDYLIKFLAKYGCEMCTVEKDICENIMFTICGFDADQFNKTLLPVILSHTPAGASVKTVVHYAQEMDSGLFQQFDYGPLRNLIIYNTTYAPSYNLSKMTIPIALFYSQNDWLAAEKDVEKLSTNFKNIEAFVKIAHPYFNHLDFLWAINVRELLYDQVIALMNNFPN